MLRTSWQFRALAPLVGVCMAAIMGCCSVELAAFAACILLSGSFAYTSIRLRWIV